MRAPYQILALQYRIVDGEPQFCVLNRSDRECWQFVSGGGEDDETPLEAAKREIWEETGIRAENLIELKSIAYIPAYIYAIAHTDPLPESWRGVYVVPESAFAFECEEEPTLSAEHSGYEWMSYGEACRRVMYDSNRTAMYELLCRLKGKLM